MTRIADKLIEQELKDQLVRCKDCKWWGRHADQVCDRTNNIQTESGPQMFAVDATAADDQGLDAWLETGPEFGCIHGEA